MCQIPARAVTAFLSASAAVAALDVGTTAAIKASAKSIASGLVQLYPNANSTTESGLFGSNNSWWEDGAAFGSLVDYWALTGDDEYNSLVQHAFTVQAMPDSQLRPSVQATTETNSGQAIWALSALSGAEQNFPSKNIDLLSIAKSVFEQQIVRWDNSICGGGLRLTLNPASPNYDIKDAFSVGTFFQLAARLALQTRNGTYTLWANRAYDWAATIGLINSEGNQVYDYSNSSMNCSYTSMDQTQWSINAATFLYGSAVMFNVTSLQTWVSRAESFITTTNSTFFQNGVVFEPECNMPCKPSQQAYKALLVRWMARAALVAPFATSGLQQIIINNGNIVADDCDETATSSCIISGERFPDQMTALDSVNALLIGRAADSSSGVGSSPTMTAGGVSSPSAKSSASYVALRGVLLVVAFWVSFIIILLP